MLKSKTAPAILAFIIIAFYTFPTIFGYLVKPQGSYYLGQATWFDPWDINVYLSAIHWAQKNGLYYQNQFTTDVQNSRLIYPLYTFTGVVFNKTDPRLLYFCEAIISSTLLIFTIHKAAYVFLKNKAWVLLAILLTTLGGGFGFLSIKIPDVSITPFTFASPFQKPHEALALALYITALTLLYKGLTNNNKQFISKSLLSLAGSVIFYPYNLISYSLIALIFILINYKKNLFSKVTLFFPKYVFLTLFLFIYSMYLLTGRGYQGIFSQDLHTPNFVILTLGYGVFIPFLAIQLKTLVKNKYLLFLSVWFLTNTLLSYTPFGFARLFLRGNFLPLVLISIIFIDKIKIKTVKISVLFIVIPITLATSTLIFIFRLSESYAKKSTYYVDSQTLQVINYLSKNTNTGEGVLVPYPLANFIPPLTYNKVYVGHPLNTPDFKNKYNFAKSFYNNKLQSEELYSFLKRENISYVLLDTKSKFEENDYPFLKQVYGSENTKLLRFYSNY